MQTFPATYFKVSTNYPESGTRIQLGNSYQFDAPPTAPDQRTFIVKLLGMAYFVDQNGQISLLNEPGRNMAVLEAFYNEHKRAQSFIFPHPVYGNVVCKFNRPLQIYEGIDGADGLLQTGEVELIEIP